MNRIRLRLQSWAERYVAGWRAASWRVHWALLIGMPLMVVGLWLGLWHVPQGQRIYAMKTQVAQVQAELEAAKQRAAARRREALRRQARLDALRAVVQASAAALVAAQKPMLSPDQLRAQLIGLIDRSGPARCVGWESTPAVSLPQSGLFRYALILHLEGDFSAVLKAVQSLEQEARRVEGYGLALRTVAYPRVRARLELYTYSDQKAWLR